VTAGAGASAARSCAERPGPLRPPPSRYSSRAQASVTRIRDAKDGEVLLRRVNFSTDALSFGSNSSITGGRPHHTIGPLRSTRPGDREADKFFNEFGTHGACHDSVDSGSRTSTIATGTTICRKFVAAVMTSTLTTTMTYDCPRRYVCMTRRIFTFCCLVRPCTCSLFRAADTDFGVLYNLIKTRNEYIA